MSFPRGACLFEEGSHADRFWITRTGSVGLDLHTPGQRATVIETFRQDDLID